MFTQTTSLPEQPRSFATGCIEDVGRAACSRCAAVGAAVACDEELCEPPPQPARIAAAIISDTNMDQRTKDVIIKLRRRKQKARRALVKRAFGGRERVAFGYDVPATACLRRGAR